MAGSGPLSCLAADVRISSGVFGINQRLQAHGRILPVSRAAESRPLRLRWWQA